MSKPRVVVIDGNPVPYFACSAYPTKFISKEELAILAGATRKRLQSWAKERRFIL